MTPTTLHPATLVADAQAIRAYAALTNDFNPLHVDPAFAAGTAAGGCIAHGTLSICLLWQSLFRTLGSEAPQRVEIDVRFIAPVRAGETIHAGGTRRVDDPDCFDVWVRGGDGVDRVRGTARLLPPRRET